MLHHILCLGKMVALKNAIVNGNKKGGAFAAPS